MEAIKLIDAGPEGSVLFELLIDEKYSNLNGTSNDSYPLKMKLLTN
jgi:hypothetical protein